MSTKSTLVSGKSFHLYEECFERDRNVYLELGGCSFETTPNRIVVEIPLAVWEVVRQHTSASYDLASLDDAQLLAEAEKRVDENRAEYRKALAEQRAARKATNTKSRSNAFFLRLYRDARLPRDKHLEKTLESLRTGRSAQRQLKRVVARLSHRPKS